MNEREFVRNPSGQEYKQLLQRLWPLAGTCSLILRETIPRDPKLDSLLQECRRFRLREDRVQNWPGTVLVEGFATQITLAAEPELLTKLLQASTSLFEWLQPDAPEDIALYRDSGEVLMETIAHEGLGSLFLTESEEQEFTAEFPKLFR